MKYVAVLISFLFIFGCSGNVIQDSETSLEPVVIEEVPAHMELVDYTMDNMGTDRLQYHVNEDGSLIVDAQFADDDLKRGDIVYFFPPQAGDIARIQWLARVIALPNEKIKIEQGQVYIDDQKLDTFYGKERPKQERSQTNMNEIEVPEGHLFILGDNWSRSIDSRIFGPLPIELVEGIVVGVTNTYNAGQ